jgi:hypothetical protein
MLGNHLTWKMHMLAGSDKAIHAGDPKSDKGWYPGGHPKQAKPDNIDNPGQ